MQRIVTTTARHDGRRGLRGQRLRRRREREVREAAVAFGRWCHRCGVSCDVTAAHLALCPRTLRRWERAWRRERLDVRPRGRPPDLADEELRAEMLSVLHEDPALGVPALRCRFPEMGKRDLQELVRRFRHAHRRRRRLWLRALRWTRAGAVWAADFSEPPCRVQGVYDRLLCVRDLGSEYQLEAMPTIGKSARCVLDTLNALVRWHGAPLVLKLDNDGVFRSREVKRWAADHGVLLLYSPVRRPSYNGSVEAGIGSIKVGAHYASALRDRPGEWTCDDLELARRQMNERGRPRGAHGPNPDELWSARQRIDDDERRELLADYRQRYDNACNDRDIGAEVHLQHDEQASIDRHAISRMLVVHGFLLFRRRRITLSIRRFKTDRIT